MASLTEYLNSLFTGQPGNAPQNTLAPPIWPASNPVGTERLNDPELRNPDPSFQPAATWGGRPVSQAFKDKVDLGMTMALGFTGGTTPIKAYHGSPHSFDRFDVSKIGTGEGAQAYGHGLYFAENEGVARQYRDVLASRSETNTPEGVAKFWANMQGGHEGGISHLESVLRQMDRFPNSYPAGEADKINKAIEYLKSGGDIKPTGGHMYEAQIAADPDHFLHWDKPLSEQSPQVQEALKKTPYPPHDMRVLPREYLAELETNREGVTRHGDPAALASQALRDAGIPGIRYLDQGSRGAGEGTHNYVVFSDDVISILKKYGLAGLMTGAAGAGGGAVAAGGGAEQ